ncbi:MAG TPA: TRAP transporter large permease subunit, partial [Thiomonas arsenitoxydans]|nr:TRAP transporter large permease subunit [Thiomonas arsenitoxydans]
MGLISLPIMLRYGYDRRLASGVIAASGTLAQIIPPSLVLIVMADQLGRSVGDMYKGAFIPGFALTGLYLAYVVGVTLIKPQWAPALPPEARTIREPNGDSGLRSLGILFGVVLISSIVLARNYSALLSWRAGHEVIAATDETIVVAMTFGVILSLVLSLLNRAFRLNLLSQMAERVTFALVPPLTLIFLVLGTIFLGVATPTEGGAMGAVGALIMAFSRKRLNMDLLKQALNTTTKLSTFVLFILIGSTVFNLVFQGLDGRVWVEHLLTSLPGGVLGFLIVVNILVFVLAFFLDFFELSFIIIPLLGPVAEKLGIDLIWFGVLLAVNMQTSFMHPPFGFALFYLRSVAAKDDYTDKETGKRIARVTTGQIYWGAVPFVLIQIIMVGLVIAFPGLVTSGLDHHAEVDINKVQIIGPSDDNSYESIAPPSFGASEAAPAEGGSAPAAEEEDPAAAVMRSLQAEPSASGAAK